MDRVSLKDLKKGETYWVHIKGSDYCDEYIGPAVFRGTRMSPESYGGIQYRLREIVDNLGDWDREHDGVQFYTLFVVRIPLTVSGRNLLRVFGSEIGVSEL